MTKQELFDLIKGTRAALTVRPAYLPKEGKEF